MTKGIQKPCLRRWHENPSPLKDCNSMHLRHHLPPGALTGYVEEVASTHRQITGTVNSLLKFW